LKQVKMRHWRIAPTTSCHFADRRYCCPPPNKIDRRAAAADTTNSAHSSSFQLIYALGKVCLAVGVLFALQHEELNGRITTVFDDSLDLLEKRSLLSIDVKKTFLTLLLFL